MPAIGQIKSHNPVFRLQESWKDLKIGRRARQGLHIAPPLLRVESISLKSSFLTKQFNLVNVLISAIVTITGVAFRILGL